MLWPTDMLSACFRRRAEACKRRSLSNILLSLFLAHFASVHFCGARCVMLSHGNRNYCRQHLSSLQGMIFFNGVEKPSLILRYKHELSLVTLVCRLLSFTKKITYFCVYIIAAASSGVSPALKLSVECVYCPFFFLAGDDFFACCFAVPLVLLAHNFSR